MSDISVDETRSISEMLNPEEDLVENEVDCVPVENRFDVLGGAVPGWGTEIQNIGGNRDQNGEELIQVVLS